jgi:hypothetical protein
MNRNGLYVIIAILVIAIAGFAIYTYQEQNRPGVEVRVDDGGLSVNTNG